MGYEESIWTVPHDTRSLIPERAKTHPTSSQVSSNRLFDQLRPIKTGIHKRPKTIHIHGGDDLNLLSKKPKPKIAAQVEFEVGTIGNVLIDVNQQKKVDDVIMADRPVLSEIDASTFNQTHTTKPVGDHCFKVPERLSPLKKMNDGSITIELMNDSLIDSSGPESDGENEANATIRGDIDTATILDGHMDLIIEEVISHDDLNRVGNNMEENKLLQDTKIENQDLTALQSLLTEEIEDGDDMNREAMNEGYKEDAIGKDNMVQVEENIENDDGKRQEKVESEDEEIETKNILEEKESDAGQATSDDCKIKYVQEREPEVENLHLEIIDNDNEDDDDYRPKSSPVSKHKRKRANSKRSKTVDNSALEYITKPRKKRARKSNSLSIVGSSADIPFVIDDVVDEEEKIEIPPDQQHTEFDAHTEDVSLDEVGDSDEDEPELLLSAKTSVPSSRGFELNDDANLTMNTAADCSVDMSEKDEKIYTRHERLLSSKADANNTEIVSYEENRPVDTNDIIEKEVEMDDTISERLNGLSSNELHIIDEKDNQEKANEKQIIESPGKPTDVINHMSNSSTPVKSRISISKRKKAPSLAELCSKTTPAKSRYRVGLSRNIKVESLHDYLKK